MKKLILIIGIMTSISAYAQDNDTISKLIIGMEKSALDKANNGDPSAFPEISSKDVVYFDPWMEQRLDGLDKLTELYKKLVGQGQASKYEMINPKVQSVDKMAVLTFNFISYDAEPPHKWNCTEVYRLENDGKWRIIQTHWSFTKPELK